MPCIAVASPSRARKAHIPARNCARPPNVAANGKRTAGPAGPPYQPARYAATMKVAPAKPNSPRIDGAAIGCRKTRVWSTHSRWSRARASLPLCVCGAAAMWISLLGPVEGHGPPLPSARAARPSAVGRLTAVVRRRSTRHPGRVADGRARADGARMGRAPPTEERGGDRRRRGARSHAHEPGRTEEETTGAAPRRARARPRAAERVPPPRRPRRPAGALLDPPGRRSAVARLVLALADRLERRVAAARAAADALDRADREVRVVTG